MTVFNFITLFGGLALFLYGMRVMSENLERGASGTLKKAMEKVTNNPFVGFLLGLIVTSIIQSSTATIVLTSGLVASGLISLHQSLGIIIGANVGTTITGQIIRLLDVNADEASWLNMFKPSTLAPLAAIIGIVIIMAFKFNNSKSVGNIAMGFGILFTGLLNMTAAVSPLSESEAFSELFITLADKPVLGFLAGAAVAFTIQSSSATIGILQTLSTTGLLSFSSIYSVIIGIYLGDCITTAIVCSIGAKADAKRTGMVHILFNICEAVIVLGGVTLLHSLGVLDSIWSVPINSGGIANTHTIFNLTCAILLLPVCGLLEKVSRVIIRDPKAKAGRLDSVLDSLDDTLFDSPALALASAHKVINQIAETAFSNVERGMDSLLNFNKDALSFVREDEAYIDTLTDHVSDYMVRMSPFVPVGENNDKLNYYIKCASEFERIGDHAVNLAEKAVEINEKSLTFTDEARKELEVLRSAINEIIEYTQKAFNDGSTDIAFHIEPIEETIDDLVTKMRTNHLMRLRSGNCNVLTGSEFLDVLVDAERISDQCSNVGVHIFSMADPEAAMQHDFIKRLHNGENEKFNNEYIDAKKKYFECIS